MVNWTVENPLSKCSKCSNLFYDPPQSGVCEACGGPAAVALDAACQHLMVSTSAPGISKCTKCGGEYNVAKSVAQRQQAVVADRTHSKEAGRAWAKECLERSKVLALQRIERANKEAEASTLRDQVRRLTDTLSKKRARHFSVINKLQKKIVEERAKYQSENQSLQDQISAKKEEIRAVFEG